jgi:hypothetical protein
LFLLSAIGFLFTGWILAGNQPVASGKLGSGEPVALTPGEEDFSARSQGPLGERPSAKLRFAKDEYAELISCPTGVIAL